MPCQAGSRAVAHPPAGGGVGNQGGYATGEGGGIWEIRLPLRFDEDLKRSKHTHT